MTPRLEMHKPNLLLISPRVPDPDGVGSRWRTWDLLCHATRGHHTYLACICDGSVTLPQWRAVDELAEGLDIVPPTLRQRVGRYLLRPLKTAESGRLPRLPALETTLDRWVGEVKFDMVLTAHPHLRGAAWILGLPVLCCDARRPWCTAHGVRHLYRQTPAPALRRAA